MTAERLQLETSQLEKYFKKRYMFENLGTQNEYVDVGVKTQSGKIYRLNILLNSDYPNSLPEVYVTYPLPLIQYNGEKLPSLSVAFHTLKNDGDKVQICHFHEENWNPKQSLFKIAMKARIWLEAYEGHLRTGKPIDDFLNH